MSNMPQSDMNDQLVLQNVRIARVSTVPYFVITQLKKQIQALGESGAFVMAVSSDGPELAILDSMVGVRSVPIEIARSISLISDVVGLIKLYLFFKRERIQISHSTTPKAGLLTAIAGKLAGVPIRLHTYTGQPWVGMHGLKGWIARTSDKLIAKLNTRCYADSLSQMDFLVEQKIILSKKITVLGAGSLAGVDIKRFNRERFTSQQCEELRNLLLIPQGVPLILFLGRISIDKGVRELLGSFGNLKASGSPAHLLFVGPIDIASGAAGCVSQEDIEQVPDAHWVAFTDIPEAYLAMADVLCLPSYREGFGTVVIEAAAMGLPTVGTSIYGLTDAVMDGKTGLLVEPKSVKALTNALTNLLGDSRLRLDMGQAAKHRARELFDAEKINQQLISEYHALLNMQKIESPITS
jgi:glycosyltransferase involved in cell wall biosynthesis